MIAQILLITGSSILLILGTLHLFYTFFTPRFQPRNPQVETDMKNTTPKLTKETTMWSAWIGFNGSHSLGAIYFGIVNLILTIGFFDLYKASLILQLVNILTMAFYLYLARKYWFRIPLRGIFISTVCFIIASVLFLF